MNTNSTLSQRMGAPIAIALILLFGMTAPAAAAGFTDFLNNVVDEFNSARRPLALIAVMIVGLLYMFNIIDMRRTGQVIIGIIVLFAAGEIIDLITS